MLVQSLTDDHRADLWTSGFSYEGLLLYDFIDELIDVGSESPTWYSAERLSRSMHLLSISPLERTYSRVIPGGKYLSRIFLSFIFKK